MTVVNADVDKAGRKGHVFRMSDKEYRYVPILLVVLLKKQSIKSIFIVSLYQGSFNDQVGSADGVEGTGKSGDGRGIPEAARRPAIGTNGGGIQEICQGVEHHPPTVSLILFNVNNQRFL